MRNESEKEAVWLPTQIDLEVGEVGRMPVFVEWKPVPGYGGKYEASFFGLVRRIYRTKPPRILTGYRKASVRRLVVGLTGDDGKKREEVVAQAVYTAHVGKIPEGHVIVHKNGSFLDNSVNNLAVMPLREIGGKYGGQSRRKSVVKISPGGQEVETYSSAREAARKNYMSYQTVIDRCNGKTKKRTAPDGYDYAWEDSAVSVSRAKERISMARAGMSDKM